MEERNGNQPYVEQPEQQAGLSKINRNDKTELQAKTYFVQCQIPAPPIRCFYPLTLCALQIVFTITIMIR